MPCTWKGNRRSGIASETSLVYPAPGSRPKEQSCTILMRRAWEYGTTRGADVCDGSSELSMGWVGLDRVTQNVPTDNSVEVSGEAFRGQITMHFPATRVGGSCAKIVATIDHQNISGLWRARRREINSSPFARSFARRPTVAPLANERRSNYYCPRIPPLHAPAGGHEAARAVVQNCNLSNFLTLPA